MIASGELQMKWGLSAEFNTLTQSYPLQASCPLYELPKILTFLLQLNVSESERTQHTLSGDKVPAFRHPVKLLWPKSKQFDYLYEDAAHLLANFPVQATISFYQESDSESENEDDS
ncbi:hypothetical protein chiPu_0005232 [Chiloscyllium punctatum]|uniref:Protein ripply2 n=1 Tax=Chiloscyllium punctatum TaxID=137246 RepID=A0A401S8U8_CHIPU|nr:hypothetical protein [Chiloscyllium punctatum]